MKRILASAMMAGSFLFPSMAHATPTLAYDADFTQPYPSTAFANCAHNGCPNAPLSYMGAEPAGNLDDSGHCVYNAAQVVSEANGYLDLHAHSTNGTCWAVNLHPLTAPMLYGQYEIQFNAQNIPNYHFVMLLWPVNEKTGELDGPEANLGSPWHGFDHPIAGVSKPGQFNIELDPSEPSPLGWHTWTVSWEPSGVKMYLDNRLLTVQGPREPIPNTPMYTAIHLESDMNTGVRPNANSVGDVFINWVRIWQGT